MHPDEVARLCLECYDALGTQGAKPRVRADRKHEWTVLAGVVLSVRSTTSVAQEGGKDGGPPKVCPRDTALCIALGTGVKALPYSELSIHGDVLHDCHAEVLARRAARRWLLSRLVRESAMPSLGDPSSPSSEGILDGLPFIFAKRHERTDTLPQPWRVREGVEFHLYCSTVPCGDASSRMVLQQQKILYPNDGDDAGWLSHPTSSVLRGRAHSSAVDVHLRTKPGRSQAEASISMSCTDKIASWSMLGFQGALLYQLMGCLPFASFVIGDEALRCEKQSSEGATWLAHDAAEMLEHFRDVFIKKRTTMMLEASQICMPHIALSGRSFAHSREALQRRLTLQRARAHANDPSDEQDIVPCAASLTWTCGSKPQGIVDGRRQGASARRAPGQALKETSRSPLCKLDWFRAVADASAVLQGERLDHLCQSTLVKASALRRGTMSYYDAKHEKVGQYQAMKQALRGTRNMTHVKRLALERSQISTFLQSASSRRKHHVATTTTGDTEPTNDEETHSYEQDVDVDDSAPFRGWLIAGPSWENFHLDGSVALRT